MTSVRAFDARPAEGQAPRSLDAEDRRRHSSRGRLVALRLVLVVLAFVFPLVGLEVALRVFGPFLPGNYDTGAYVRRHPILGHYHVPDFEGWIKTPRFTVRLDINPMGFRDPRQSYAKPPGTFRILALGDSYVEAAQVQADQMVTTRLEALLGAESSQPVEVINGGVFGYGTGQEYLLLNEEGVKYAPDLIVLFFCHANDVPNNDYRLELPNEDLSRALKPYYDLDDSGNLVLFPAPPPTPQSDLRARMRSASMLYNVIETGVVYKLELQNPREAFNAIGGLVDPIKGKYDVEQTGEWKQGWKITGAILERMRDRARELDIPLVVVSIPAWRMLDDAYWQRSGNANRLDRGISHPTAPVRALTAITDQLGLPHLDLLPAMRARTVTDGLNSLYIEDDLHWTAAGHELAAEQVGRFLETQNLIPR
ncbi:MAG: SGNH/GDSL hydrolase family protein [Chloroflexi bacterium]|nr:SGNH/GDSL hydrolase family protein [Chloroflexota bacterium]